MEPNSILVGTHPEMQLEEFTLLEEKIMDTELQVEINMIKLYHSYRYFPGYGTSWGTNFAGGAGRYSKGYSGKALGLGVGAGFLGGMALSTMGSMAMYSVYHRYNMYMMMMHMNNPMMYGYNRGYYNNYYNS